MVQKPNLPVWQLVSMATTSGGTACLQEALQEQQAAESEAAPSNHQQAAGASQGAPPRPTTGASQGPPPPRQSPFSQHQTAATDNLHRAAPGSAPGSALGSGQGPVPQQQQETRQAGSGGTVLARPDTAANKAKRAGGRASKRGTGDSGSGDSGTGDSSSADDLASPAANAQPVSRQGDEALKASRQQPPSAAQNVQQGDAAQQQRQEDLSQRRGQQEHGSRGDMAGAVSSRSIDGDDGMLDRFGTVDIITGKPVRDLKLDPVRQLVKWRESFFGSRDSVSESLDKDDEGPPT